MKPRFWPKDRSNPEPRIVDLIVYDESFDIAGLVGLDLNKASIADFLDDMPIGTTVYPLHFELPYGTRMI